MKLSDLVVNVASALSWEKETAKATGEARKTLWGECWTALAATPVISDAEEVAMRHALGLALAERGVKPNVIKTKRSEFGVIIQNRKALIDFEGGWNSAVKTCRESTMTSIEKLEAEYKAAKESLDKAQERFDNALQALNDAYNVTEPSLDILERDVMADMIADTDDAASEAGLFLKAA